MKDITLKVRDRVVRLTISTNSDETEYGALLYSVEKYFHKDPYVNKKKSTHYFIYEFEDPSFENNLVEVPIDCETLPSNVIHLRFSPIESPQKVQLVLLEHQENSQDLSTGIDVEISDAATHGKRSLNFEEVVELTEEQEENLCEPPSAKKPKNSIKTPKISHQWTAANFPVPQVSSRVLTHFENKTFVTNIRIFIHEVGDFFKNEITNSYANIYKIYVAALMSRYPQLVECAEEFSKSYVPRRKKSAGQVTEESVAEVGQDDLIISEDDPIATEKATEMFGEALVCMIQNYVHNKRCKRKVKSVVTDQGAPKRGSIEAQLEKITSPKQRSRSTTPKTNQRKTYKLPESFEEQLVLLSSSRKKQQFEEVRQALSVFKHERWAKLANDVEYENITDVVKAWPCYLQASVIETEFLLRLGLSKEQLKGKFDFAVEILAEVNQKPCSSELERLMLLEGIETELKLPAAKDITNLFTLIKVDPKRKTRGPNCFEANAPISTTYIDGSGRLTKTFVRALNQKMFKLDHPTALEVYCALVGTYYCFDRSYPLVSRAAFQFLDICILKKEVESPERPESYKEMRNNFELLEKERI